MRSPVRSLAAACLLAAVVVLAVFGRAYPRVDSRARRSRSITQAAYLGFDTNDYPGDAALPALRHTFSFAGFWLNQPPGGATIPWTGKREILLRNGFGFLLLFNGRLERQLKNPQRAAALGSSDAATAVRTALRESFHPGTVIFLDQEEGGEMEPAQMAYLLSWTDGVIAAHFHAGIYCSAIPASAGKGHTVITAEDIRSHAGNRRIAFFVYNDACPPSPGCVISNDPPQPSASGVSFASVWQFAQSPRRRQYTARCSATYDPNGNCYPPGLIHGSIVLDLDSADSPDPSAGRDPSGPSPSAASTSNRELNSAAVGSCRQAGKAALGPAAKILKCGKLIGQRSLDAIAAIPLRQYPDTGDGIAVSSLVILQRQKTKWKVVLRADRKNWIRNSAGYIGIDFIDDSADFVGYRVSFSNEEAPAAPKFTIWLSYLRRSGHSEGIATEIKWNPSIRKFQEYTDTQDPAGFRSEIKNPPHFHTGNTR